MIKTFPLFYYGFEITAENQYLDFKEGSGPEITAEIDVGSYTPTKFIAAVKSAMNTAGAFAYDVSFNRATRQITIVSTGGSHKLLTASGTHSGSDPFTMLGFSKLSDTSLAASHAGTLPSGDMYQPQIWLQDYIPSMNLQGAADASINKTASGKVEVIKFGTEKFMECNITLISDTGVALGSAFRASTTGVADLRRFLQFLTTKSPIEFMEDEENPEIYETMLLESTSEDSKGIKYRLRELYDKNLAGYFESGKLVFRIIEDV